MAKKKKTAPAPAEEPRYDVFIYELNTGLIDCVAGQDMRLSGFYSAERRLETVLGRINEHFSGAIVKAGKYKKGDVLPENEERF